MSPSGHGFGARPRVMVAVYVLLVLIWLVVQPAVHAKVSVELPSPVFEPLEAAGGVAAVV